MTEATTTISNKRKRSTGTRTASGKKKGSSQRRSQSKSGIREVTNRVREGRFLTLEYFRRHAFIIIALMSILLALMGLRYKTKTKMMEIEQLKVELKHAESAKLAEKAEYMSLIREREMLEMVNSKGLGLQFQEQPPYQLEIKK